MSIFGHIKQRGEKFNLKKSSPILKEVILNVIILYISGGQMPIFNH